MRHSAVINLSICALLAISSVASVPIMAAPSPRPIAVGTQSIADAPYLRTVLPQSAFAYMRIPNLWGILGSPSGNIFTQLLQSAAHQEAISSIRSGILARFLPNIPKEWQGLAEFLLAQTRSPLELAVFTGETNAQNKTSFPEILLTVTLDQADLAAVNSMLDSLVKKMPELAFPTPLQADGSGKLVVSGVPLDIYFDLAKRRLFLGVALLNNLAPPLQQRIAKMQPSTDHPLHEVEAKIDTSGQGLLLWIEPDALLKSAEDLGEVGTVAMLRVFGFAEARSISVGMGGSGGKQRFRMALEMPQVGLRSVFPAIRTNLPFVAAAGLDTVFMFGLPTVDDLAKLEANLDFFISAEDRTAAKATAEQLIGLTVEQLFSTFRGELLVLHDKAGYYGAIGLRNPANYETMLKHLVQRYELKYETRELLGTTFHHLVLPSLANLEQTPIDPKTAVTDPIQVPGLLELMINQPTHLYWIERYGYLVFAEIPQVLMDVLYSPSGVDVASWLRESQGMDPSGALLLASARTTGVPQLLHQVHLWLLNYLGDFTGHPIDLFTLPSVRELNLPDAGAYSFQFISSADELGLELVYESNPLEGVLSMGGLATVATAGLVAGVAIPTYLTQNSEEVAPKPEITADTLEGLVTVRDQVANFYSANQRFPNAKDIEKLTVDVPKIANAEFTIAPDTGVITIKFTNLPETDGNELTLMPVINRLRWECDGTLSTALRPESICQP